MANNRKQKNVVWIGSLVLAAVLVAVGVFHRNEIYGQLQNWKLIPTDEHFTELYFNNYEAFSKEITLPGKTVSFSFTVHNLEGVTTTYPYAVFFLDTLGKKTILGQGSVTLSDGASQSIIIPYNYSSLKDSGRVIILLNNSNEQIDFLVPKVS